MVTFDCYSANSPLALTYEIVSEDVFLKKDTYTHYPSYATLVSFVALLEAIQLQFLCTHIFGKFCLKIILIVLKSVKNPNFPAKSAKSIYLRNLKSHGSLSC